MPHWSKTIWMVTSEMHYRQAWYRCLNTGYSGQFLGHRARTWRLRGQYH